MPVVQAAKSYSDVYSYKDQSPGVGNQCSREIQENGTEAGPAMKKFSSSNFHLDYGQQINNSTLVLQRFASLYDSQEFCDIELIVGNQVHLAHKLILCQSKVFKVMLTSPLWPESQGTRVLLKEDPECCAVFGQFLRYLYAGLIHLTHSNVLPLLILADKYLIPDLSDVCIEYMQNHFVSVVEHNKAVSWYQYAVMRDEQYLAETLHRFIHWNFHKILSTVQFLQMEKELLIEFLKSSELVVPDEYTLLMHVKDWILQRQHGTCTVEFSKAALEVVSCIRFPMIRSDQLVSLRSDPLVSINESFFMEKISSALEYHTYPLDVRRELDWGALAGTDKLEVYPRHYTNDFWGATFMIERFQTLPVQSVQTLMFSSPISGSEADDEHNWEWAIDIYLKGVHFQKCLMIGWTHNYVVDDTSYKTVRLAVTAKPTGFRTVQVVFLIAGVQDNVEFTKQVISRKLIFDFEDTMFNINDIVPYDELNNELSPYLSGKDGNVFKMTIIMKPCNDC